MITEHDINQLDNFICGYHNDDYQIIDEIITFYNDSPDKRKGLVYDHTGQIVVDNQRKLSTDLPLSLNANLCQRYVCDYLQPALQKYMDKYEQLSVLYPWAVQQVINIQHYDLNEGFFEWHCERNGSDIQNKDRVLVFMTYLNDVTDDGETEFLYQKLKVKPTKGLTLFWPVDWNFTHRGITSKTQTKTIVTGWYSFK